VLGRVRPLGVILPQGMVMVKGMSRAVRVHGSGWKHHGFPENLIDTGTMLGHPGYGPSPRYQSPIFSTMLENDKGRRLSREREETGTHLTGRGWTATTGSNERGAEKGEWANKGTGAAYSACFSCLRGGGRTWRFEDPKVSKVLWMIEYRTM